MSGCTLKQAQLLGSISKSQSLGQKLPEKPSPHVQQQTRARVFLARPGSGTKK